MLFFKKRIPFCFIACGSHIFGPLLRLDILHRILGGSGIGLSLSRRMMIQQGGMLDLAMKQQAGCHAGFLLTIGKNSYSNLCANDFAGMCVDVG